MFQQNRRPTSVHVLKRKWTIRSTGGDENTKKTKKGH